jgi:hypothetical protein
MNAFKHFLQDYFHYTKPQRRKSSQSGVLISCEDNLTRYAITVDESVHTQAEVCQKMR